MNHLLNRIIIAFAAILLVGLAVVVLFPTDRPPQVVVNLPKDAKPLATLTQPGDKVVAGERATLWWTVFKTCLDQKWSPNYCVQQADAAVKAVYGPLPSHP